MINLYDILDAADGQLFGEPAAQIFSGFSFDANTVKQGELYVALKTEMGDGHHTMQQAVQAGAMGLMCTHPPTFETEGITVMIMRDVQAALMRWTSYILRKYGTTVIGVTGSVGKTTTKAAILEVLKTKFNVYDGYTEVGGAFGLPHSLGKLTRDHPLAVLEYSIHNPGDMSALISAAVPAVGVVTNVGLAHLDQLGDLDSIILETRHMIENLPDDGLAILNYDNPQVRNMQQFTKADRLTLSVDVDGTSFGADLTAYNIISALDKTGFDLRYGNQRYIAKWVHLLGAHQIYAVLAALGVGLSFGISLEEGLEALTKLQPLPGRMHPFTGKNGCHIIDDTYSASPDSIKSALEWLKQIKPKPSIRETMVGQFSPRGRIHFVVGTLDNLGDYTARGHREVGKQASEVATYLVTNGEDASLVAQSAIDHEFSREFVEIVFATQDAINAVTKKLSPKDMVFITGGAKSMMEQVVSGLIVDTGDSEKLLQRGTATNLRIDQPFHGSRVEADMSAIANNVRIIRETIPEKSALMAVVKGDAYGHGAVQTSLTALRNGADYLGVASLGEAIELRKGGIDAPILVSRLCVSRCSTTSHQL